MKASATSISVRPVKLPAASGAASTRTFLTHCFGRRPLIIASGRFFGGWRFVLMSTPVVCGSGLNSGSSYTFSVPCVPCWLSVIEFSFPPQLQPWPLPHQARHPPACP